MYQRHITGKDGEEMAVAYLKHKRFAILQRNYRTRYGEVDVICKKDSTIIFVEVKTRSKYSKGKGFEAINYQKIRKLKSAGAAFLKETKRPFSSLRIDVISIDDGEIKHFENVTI